MKSSRKPQSYKLPDELKGGPYENMPLYIIIAHWALLRGNIVTVRDVCQGFNISIRRASDFLEYLTEQGSMNIDAECFLLPQPTNSRLKRRAWRVIRIKNKYSCIAF